MGETTNNKRIVKNTVMLYIRMFVLMAISLFTSRVVLQALGVTDFGIYNVVAGVVSMMGILNSAMTVSTQRYLTFELGKGESNFPQLHKTFNVSFLTYVLLGIIFLVIAETVGVWFVNSKLVIPADRLEAANWCYQFCVISVINTLLVNPYNASIIAHEKMDIYAYVSISESLLKLAIVYAIYISPVDKLITYGFLYMAMSLVVTMVYRIYCIRHFAECKLKWVSDKKLFKELITYSGWNLFGSAAALVKSQGVNILLNVFFNPAVNAARGIAVQVDSQLTIFSSNFYTAVRPQITKYYSANDLGAMNKLIFRSSKMNFYLVLIIAAPILIEASFIINLWLGQLPEYVVEFARLSMVVSIITAMSTPIMTAAHSTGKIALYQSVVGTILILIVPVGYLVLRMGYSPISIYIVSILFSLLSYFVRLWILKRLMPFPVLKYIKDVFVVNIIVAALALSLPVYLHITMVASLTSTVVIMLVTLLWTGLVIYLVGLNKDEKKFFMSIVETKILNRK